jgi:hypothetical protein
MIPDPRPVAISRHAIERYIERVEPVDELEAHSQIAGMIQRSRFFGRTGRVLSGNVSLVIDGRCVVTVLTKDQRPKKRTARRTFGDDGE